jgi:serine/threonine-protein kinase
MIGRTFLRRFRVDRLLCEGGMGRLYVARALDGGPEVVVKVLKEHLAAEPATRERFRREIQILSRFQHPYVVKFHGGSVDDPAGMFLVMEYVRGRLLEASLREGRRFTPERIGKLLAQLCDVLQAIHDHGIVHCDVKPGNIMVFNPDSPFETIKLMDFGLAKSPTSFSLTALEMHNSGQVAVGSPGYMSPEQAAGHDVDQRADIYSLGVVLYELFTGRLPFERASAAELLAAHRYEAPPAFAARCPGLSAPPRLEMVVHKCLEKHRERRPQNAGELLRLYEQALGRRLAAPPKPAAPAVAVVAPPPEIETPRPAPQEMVDLNAAVYKLEVRMSASIAILKLRGFVHDLGGQLRDSEPGVIRVWLDSALLDAVRSTARSAVSADRRSWLSGSSAAATAITPSRMASVTIGMEMRLERTDPKQPDHVTITVNMRARNNVCLSRRDLKERYDKIHRELQAYLQIGR